MNDETYTVVMAEITHYTGEFSMDELVAELGLTRAEIRAMSDTELYQRIRDNDALDETLKEADPVLDGTRFVSLTRS